MSNIYNMTDTWTGGTAYTAVKMNVTDTSSTAGSLLADFQVGGVSKISAVKDATLNIYNINDSTTTNYERLNISWTATANQMTISSQAGGTGTARSLVMQLASGGATGSSMTLSSNLFFHTANGSVYFDGACSPQNAISDMGVVGNEWRYIRALGAIQTKALTVATLPAAATAAAGARSFVTDATVATFGSAAVGGGTNKVPVYTDGTSWFIG